MSLVDGVGDSAAEFLALAGVEANSEVSDLGVRDNPCAFIGIIFKFFIIHLESALYSSTKLISNGKGLVGNGIDIDSSEFDVSWSGKDFL